VVEVVQGTVIASHGPLVRVQVGDQTLVVASRRRLNWEGGVPADPRVVVGDLVEVEMRRDQGVVVAVRPRRTALLRQAPSSRRAQVLAANVDQALLVFAACLPEPKQGLLDRFLVACQLAGIEAIVTINKVDQGIDAVEEWLPTYRGLDYAVLLVSARTGRGLGEIKRRLAARTTLFCGPSGAGKSSLLNAVYPGFRLKVGSISEATGKGRHITSTAELMPLPYGGFVVDTPGLREFGMWELSRDQLQAAFPEIDTLAVECRFSDCRHVQEPDCRVRQRLEEGELDPQRYRSYLALMEEVVSP
jgi:ribosome biogenesis GTPase